MRPDKLADPVKFQLAPGVCVFRTPDGAIVSAAAGCFRLSGAAATLFLSKVIPTLYCPENAPRYQSPKWVELLGQQLIQAKVIKVSARMAAPKEGGHKSKTVGVSRRTPLALNVLARLIALGFEPTDSFCKNSFVITDLSGLDIGASLEIVREVFQSGSSSVCIWKRGAETFYGPICAPQLTACWNCARLRFSDSIPIEDIGTVGDDDRTGITLTENVLLAIRYPGIAGYGCLVADDGITASLHSVAPVPWCEICGGVAEASRLASLTHSLHVPDGLRSLADSRGGIIRRVFISDGGGIDGLTVPKCCSVTIAPFRNDIVSNPASNGEGKGATREESVRSAIGEGIERYSASVWKPSTFIHAPFGEIADQAFDPRWLVLYEDMQYEDPKFTYARFDEELPMHWTVGQWLDTGSEVKVPALATYVNFRATTKERFCQTTSSGLAAGDSFEDAALRALYELIERDAFMLYWLAKRPGLRVDPKDCDELTCLALSEIKRLGARIELFVLDLETQHPTVVCLGLGDGRVWPGVTIGLATHADIDIAVRKAVLEHRHYGTYLRRLMREGRHGTVQTMSDVLGNLDHGLYYIHPEHVRSLDFFRGDRGPGVAIGKLRSKYRQKATMSACVSSLREAGIRTAAVDVTSPDVALSGVRVVRAFGVNMQPIYFGFGYERCRNPRLKALPSQGVERTPHPVA